MGRSRSKRKAEAVQVNGRKGGRPRSISDEQIQALRIEAGEAGDLRQVAICDRALDGSARARRKCAGVIAAATAMATE
jgi:hypothetical protein